MNMIIDRRPLASNRRQDRRALLLLVPLAIYIVTVLVVPLVVLIRASFAESVIGGMSGFTFDSYLRFFSTPFYWNVLGTTLLLSVLAVALTVVLGVPYAYWLLRRPNGQSFHLLALFAPLLINQVVRIFGLQILINSVNRMLAQAGLPPLPLTYNFAAVLLGQVVFLFPFMVISVYAALSRLPISIEEAAATLGASRVRVFFHVVLPACRPGIIAGIVLTFTTSIGAYLVPRMMGGGQVTTVPVLIYNNVSQGQSIPIAAASGLILVLLVLPILRLVSARGAAK
ncbi:MAG: potH [Microbacteriaceae bacterium]|jgi:putative spermidine/putrescine transport system permease protein|nr:potH [Microbacteriaceae bacterium]